MFPQGWFLLEIPRGHSVLFPFMAARNCLSNLSCDPHFPVLKVSHSSLCFPHLSSCGDYIFQVRSSHPTPTSTDPCSSRQSRITSLPLPTSFDHICKALVTIRGYTANSRNQDVGVGAIIQFATVPNHSKEYIWSLYSTVL